LREIFVLSPEGLSMSKLTRRQFAGAAAATLAAPTFIRARNLADRLNIAMIACGGRGAHNLGQVKGENITVLCDVDANAVEKAAATHKEAAKFTDLRKVFDKPQAFDAVMVSTCEHTHAFGTMLALKHGKHVYCEKPLTHNIYEARVIREAAAKTKCVTQMGIQMHASETYRRVVELVQGGAIGGVREVHVWVSRAWGLQSEEAAKRNKDVAITPDSPKETAPVPPHLDWELWLGPAPARPYHPTVYAGPKWYRFWDFGNGTMSDLGSHRNDLPFWALNLEAPLTVEASGPPAHPDIAPATMSATYEFGPRGNQPAVKMTWYQGEMKPEIWTKKGIPQWGDGCLFVGDKGMLLADYGRHLLLPEKDFAGYKGPDPSLPRVSSHWVEWVEACKGGKPCLADFRYSGWLTEANHLGNVAYRVGKKLTWDAAKMRAVNAPEADKYIRREYRKGWEL
jgi:predicted dehydrogenase